MDDTEYMLTTVDNPYDPFTQFDQWLDMDTALGYHSSSLLARIVVTSNDLSQTDQRDAINSAIDEIVNENVSGMHMKVSSTPNLISSDN